ncbi:replication protein A 70 kDa DNA-binding subunit B isoform X3 [Cannabis sativa]|uniref:replication protein A 70 kDa DNA-binding subunit B isoform X3 n=1 Tax=Cannabis sativa TaxID=3483 RepID=UPI0029C9FAFE|nr:replication protein A 70 kDa DNA-binding subunit B isoform X3 [Cannabis sativa]
MLTLVEYNFTPFVSFSDHMDQSTSVDLMAVAIIVNPKKQIYTSNCLQDLQELIVVNEEKKPIGLTCWGHFVVNECATITKLIATTPIIVARRLKVTSFNEISLSTKIDSSLMINPNVAKVQTLRRWVRHIGPQLQLLSQIQHKHFGTWYVASVKELQLLTSIKHSLV